MTTVDNTPLLATLATLVNNYVTGSSSVEDVMEVALSLWALDETNVVTVPDKFSLPELLYYTGTTPLVCFVVDIDVFAISSNKKWITFDGRTLVADSQLLLGWGNNAFGQLGDNTTTSRIFPGGVAADFSDWCQICAGTQHTAAVRTGGSAWAWGSNCYGRLGDNTTTSRSSPVSVVGGFCDWCQISAGNSHTAAVRTGGSAWAWGCNGSGQLGDNTITSRSSPVSVVGGFSDWCQISAGHHHTAAIRPGSGAWTWGRNSAGQLGDNTITSRRSPVSVVGGFCDWCKISAGAAHTAAVRTGGSAWTWGYNNVGQLGDNTTTTRSSPVSVVGGFCDWCQISAHNHTAAVRTDGSAWAWGCNSYGRLGDNTTTTRSSPVSVVGGFTNWCQISAGSQHTAAVRTNSSAWAWGCNIFGQLGDCTTTSRSSPVSVVGGFTNWCQISAGGCHTLGIRIAC